MRRLGMTPSQQIVLEWLVIQSLVLETRVNVWTRRSLIALARRGLVDMTAWGNKEGEFWQATDKGREVARRVVQMDRRWRKANGLPRRLVRTRSGLRAPTGGENA